MSSNNKLQEELARFREFMRTSSKNDNWTFKLYSVPFANSPVTRQCLKHQNFTSTNENESVEQLENAILLHGDRSNRLFVVRHMNNNQDPQHVDYILQNPFYNPAVFKTGFSSSNAGIAGFNNDSNQSAANLLEMQQNHFRELMDLKEELRAEREERKIERLENIIYSIKEEKATFIDKITGFAESETGQQIVGALLGAISASIAGNSLQLSKEKSPQLAELQQQQQQHASDTSQEQEQTAQAQAVQQQVNIAIQKLSSVFTSDTLNVLSDLANYCESNPAIAQTLREQIRPKQPKSK